MISSPSVPRVASRMLACSVVSDADFGGRAAAIPSQLPAHPAAFALQATDGGGARALGAPCRAAPIGTGTASRGAATALGSPAGRSPTTPGATSRRSPGSSPHPTSPTSAGMTSTWRSSPRSVSPPSRVAGPPAVASANAASTTQRRLRRCASEPVYRHVGHASAAELAAQWAASPSKGSRRLEEPEAHKALVDVFLRIRPMGPRELRSRRSIFVGNSRTVYMDERVGGGAHRFDFERVIDSSASSPFGAEARGGQDEVFEYIGEPAVRNSLEGFHTCVFSLGQTGTGKTHTIIGTPESPGLLPRMLEQIVGEREAGGPCWLSCLELHMDRIRDLLADDAQSGQSGQSGQSSASSTGSGRSTLEVRSIPGRGVVVPNLSEVAVDDPREVLRLVNLASRRRRIARTSVNSASSRGHGVFQLTLSSGAKVCVVDLAGRENEKTTGCKGQSLAELSYINRSLFHLTTVIHALARPSSRSRVPFRDSKLTLLLSECLQSARTSVVATVSPIKAHADDTLATLRLAQAVRQISTRSTRLALSPERHSTPSRGTKVVSSRSLTCSSSQLQMSPSSSVATTVGSGSAEITAELSRIPTVEAADMDGGDSAEGALLADASPVFAPAPWHHFAPRTCESVSGSTASTSPGPGSGFSLGAPRPSKTLAMEAVGGGGTFLGVCCSCRSVRSVGIQRSSSSIGIACVGHAASL